MTSQPNELKRHQLAMAGIHWQFWVTVMNGNHTTTAQCAENLVVGVSPFLTMDRQLTCTSENSKSSQICQYVTHVCPYRQ